MAVDEALGVLKELYAEVSRDTSLAQEPEIECFCDKEGATLSKEVAMSDKS